MEYLDQVLQARGVNESKHDEKAFPTMEELEFRVLENPSGIASLVNEISESYALTREKRHKLFTTLTTFWNTYQAARDRLQRLYQHLPFALILNGNDTAFIDMVYQYLTTSESVLADVRTVRWHTTWASIVEQSIGNWMLPFEEWPENKSLYLSEAHAVFTKELQEAEHQVNRADTDLRKLFEHMTTHSFIYVTEFAFGWDKEEHLEFFRTWICGRRLQLKLPTACVTCWRKSGGSSQKICSRCKSVCYCSKECQTKHWVYHKTVCEKKL